jgi:hypothetical protein
MENYSILGGCWISFIVLIDLGIAALVIASLWRVFTKAGRQGWAAIVPIYNLIILLEITKQPLWMAFLFFIPVGNIVAIILVDIELAARFGKSSGFAVGLILLPVVFLPILAFSDANYDFA